MIVIENVVQQLCGVTEYTVYTIDATLIKCQVPSPKKKKIQDFLSDYDIYFHESYNLKPLLEVLKSHNPKKQNICDKLSEVAANYKTFRLLPDYCIFHPIAFI